ncbi:MAG: riboflavin kinase [Candidatus Pacebacteria bacterium]|nr:riboflavin kinase [Candidatus Paceibacterota bacterium]MDD5357229.1 riboflavin kinase [Candidatus Paceibacterota bacterium]
MKLLFKTTSKTGKGRGKLLGFPTVNLVIPDELSLTMQEGIYAARATIKDQKYKAALYFGTVPTFEDVDHTLELYLIDADHPIIFAGEAVEFEVVKFIRGVQKFDSPELLVRQMQKDVEAIKSIL